MSEQVEKAKSGVKPDPTAEEAANLKVLQAVRPSIVKIVNEVLASHGLEVLVARIDFADANSPLANQQAQCVMCCCAAGYYSCCTAC